MEKSSFHLRIDVLEYGNILVVYAFFVMQIYLTEVWDLSFTHAAGILNIWGGLCWILPVFFLYLADQFLGHFKMLVIGSISSTFGIIFVCLSTPLFLGPCKQYTPECIGQAQRALFYCGMVLVAVGMSVYRVSLRPFIMLEYKDELSRWGLLLRLILLTITPIIGAAALPYIKPWSIRFGIPAICTVCGMFLFLSGWGTYKRNGFQPQGSPITNVLRVFVAFAMKIFQKHPLDQTILYYKHRENGQSTRTRSLRWLEKAAMIDVNKEGQGKRYRWRVCSIEEVEEAKIFVRMIPMWTTFIICGSVASLSNTYFVEQANHMSRKIGSWDSPLQMILLITTYFRNFFAKKIALLLFDRTPTVGTRPVVGITVSMILSILCCITAARIEKRGRNRAEDGITSTSVYWLMFQFFLLAGIDVFLEKSTEVFYRNQAPRSIEVYLNHFTKAMFGLGFIFNVLLAYVVGKLRENWFQYTLNISRLDKYYWLLAILSSMNLVVFIVVACQYRYRNLSTGELLRSQMEEEEIVEAIE